MIPQQLKSALWASDEGGNSTTVFLSRTIPCKPWVKCRLTCLRQLSAFKKFGNCANNLVTGILVRTET